MRVPGKPWLNHRRCIRLLSWLNSAREPPDNPDVLILSKIHQRPATTENRAVMFGSGWMTSSVLRTVLWQLCECWITRHVDVGSEDELNVPAP